MKCDDILQLILDGMPLSEEAEDHIEVCADCRELQQRSRDLSAAGERERERDLSAASVQTILAEAARITEARVAPPHLKMKEWWFVQRLAAAAALVLAVGGGIMLANRLLTDRDMPPDEGPIMAEVKTQSEIDGLRHTIASEVSGFAARHYGEQFEGGHSGAQFSSLRSRMAVISVGLEKEFEGLN